MYPFIDEHVQPASVDVTLGNHLIIIDQLKQGLDFKNLPPSYSQKVLIPYLGGIAIYPGQFFLASTVEELHIPNDLAARIEGKSSIGRLGLTVHATAGWIDPGFRGTVTLECQNNLGSPIKIYSGMRIAQIAFMELGRPADHPYGSERLGSKYQDQMGVQPSRLKID